MLYILTLLTLNMLLLQWRTLGCMGQLPRPTWMAAALSSSTKWANLATRLSHHQSKPALPLPLHPALHSVQGLAH